MVERGFYSEQDAAKALKELLEALEVSVGQLNCPDVNKSTEEIQKKSNPCNEELHFSNEQRISRD